VNVKSSVIRAFSSLELTLSCLSLLMVLIFVGTIQQVHLGTYEAVQQYFRTFLIWWNPPGVSWKMPIFPGGGLLGLVLLVNLIFSHITRLAWTVKKAGIMLIHAGLIFLILGEFITGLFSNETLMALEVGSGASYSEDNRSVEFVVIDRSNPKFDQVISIPQRLLSRGGTINDPKLPAQIIIHQYREEVPPVRANDEPDQIVTHLELKTPAKSYGPWLFASGLETPQSFSSEGRDYTALLRYRRHYYPFSLFLKEFRHDRYPGTQIPRNFSSLVHLKDPQKNEDRDVLIYMNHPLRYRGLTFFQSGFGKDDTLSVFQVVRNPGWWVPYGACTMVGLGLILQFGMHFAGFIRKRS